MARVTKQAMIDQLTEQLAASQEVIRTLRRRLSEQEHSERRKETSRREAMNRAREAARKTGVATLAVFN